MEDEINQKHKDLELRSDEVKDILSRPPHVLVRYGTATICVILGLIFVGCFVFRYPDVVSGEVSVTTQNPPSWLVAKSDGRLKQLYIEDKQMVGQGDVIAVIDNPAKTEDVMFVKKNLTERTIVSDSLVNLPSELLSRTYELGELQSTFSTFIKAAVNYDNFISLNLTKEDEKSIHQQIKGRNVYSSNLYSQLELKRKESELAKSTFDRDKSLYEKGVLSKSEMEESEQNYLSIRQVLQQLEATILSENIENTKLANSASKLTVEYLQDKNSKYSELASAYRELISEIENWEQKYLLVAPQAGTVTFNTYWSKNQTVKTGDRVFVVVPSYQGDLIGKVEIAESGAGKVKVGQQANLKMSGYPYLEYGVLQGKVKNISLVTNENKYTIEIALSSGVKSTTGVVFDFTGELNGTAEIITEDRSIANRILSPLRYLLNNNFR